MAFLDWLVIFLKIYIFNFFMEWCRFRPVVLSSNGICVQKMDCLQLFQQIPRGNVTVCAIWHYCNTDVVSSHAKSEAVKELHNRLLKLIGQTSYQLHTHSEDSANKISFIKCIIHKVCTRYCSSEISIRRAYWNNTVITRLLSAIDLFFF